MSPSEMNDFTNLLADQQYQVVALAMGNKKILLKIALAALYPEFKDKAFLSDLIQSYKQGSDKQPATSHKCKVNAVSVSPSNQDNVPAVTKKSTNNPNVRCRNFDKTVEDLVMMNQFANYLETNNKHTGQAATGVKNHGPSVNNILGNSKRNTEDTHTL